MTLVSATVALLEADLSGRAQLAELIGAGVPQSWPPDLYERAAMKFALVLLQEPAEQRWSFWYLRTQSLPAAAVLGVCVY